MRPEEQRAFDGPSYDDPAYEGPGHIDLNDPEDVRYWSARLEATPEELQEAVQKVGPNRTAVGLYLGEVGGNL